MYYSELVFELRHNSGFDYDDLERICYASADAIVQLQQDLAAARADAETWHNTATGSGLRVVQLRNELAAARARNQECNLLLSRVLHELAGSVSLCWEPKPTGVFDSQLAIGFV
jgi:hypothetical protein